MPVQTIVLLYWSVSVTVQLPELVNTEYWIVLQYYIVIDLVKLMRYKYKQCQGQRWGFKNQVAQLGKL